MKTTKHLSVAAVLTVLMQMGCQSHTDNTRQTLHLPELNEVRIEDAFWSPKLDIWRKITANDVFIRPIAPVAFLPFIVFWFGIGDVPAIVIIFIAGFFPILLSVVAAVQHVDGIYYKIANSFGVGKVKTLFGIVFPAIFTQIANALRLALGTSWIFLVSGEMVGAQSGLGFLIMDSKNCMRFDALLATMITIGVIGFILDGLLRFAEKAISTKIGFGV